MSKIKVRTLDCGVRVIMEKIDYTLGIKIYTDGDFGIDNIEEIKVYECSILIWFNEGSENNRPWDLTLEYGNNREAEDSYNDMLSVMRELRFKQANNVHRISTTDKED